MWMSKGQLLRACGMLLAVAATGLWYLSATWWYDNVGTDPGSRYPFWIPMFIIWGAYAILAGTRPLWDSSYNPFRLLGGNTAAARSSLALFLTVFLLAGLLLLMFWFVFPLLVAVPVSLFYCVVLLVSRFVARRRMRDERRQSVSEGYDLGAIGRMFDDGSAGSVVPRRD